MSSPGGSRISIRRRPRHGCKHSNVPFRRHIRVHVHACVYIYVHKHGYIYIYICMYIHICMYVCMYVCMFRRMYVYIITQNSDGTQIQMCMYLITYTRSTTLTTYMFIRTHEWGRDVQADLHRYVRTYVQTYRCTSYLHAYIQMHSYTLFGPEP